MFTDVSLVVDCSSDSVDLQSSVPRTKNRTSTSRSRSRMPTLDDLKKEKKKKKKQSKTKQNKTNKQNKTTLARARTHNLI